MKRLMRGVHAAGVAACIGLMAAGSPATAQQHQPVGAPPAEGDPPHVLKPYTREYTPEVYTDPDTGIMSSQIKPIEPVFIPEGGFFPDGTFPQPEREAGRPMRPGGDPWIPDGSGYWAEGTEDLPGPAFQPLFQNHEGPGPNGLTPPDPDIARGLDYQVCATNDDFAVYDSCGRQLYYRDINDFLGLGDFMFDPKVIFDPWNLRWVMLYHIYDASPQTSRIVMVVSGNEIPFGLPGATYWYYSWNSVQDAGSGDASWADYWDLGYSNNCVTIAGNMFRFAGGFRWGRVVWWDKAGMYSGGGLTGWQWWNLTNADGSQTNTPRAAKMQISFSESGDNVDAYFANSRWGGGNRITLWKVKDYMGANSLTRVDVDVANYTSPPDAVQPNGASIDTIDCRLMNAVVSSDFQNGNGIELFTSLNTARGSDAACRLYKFDAVTHAVELDRDFFATGWDYWFACPTADYSGSCFWVFCRTSTQAGAYPEIRYVDMNRGVFSNSSAGLKSGTGSYGGFRWGDYFGAGMDWGDYYFNGGTDAPYKVWMYGEYGTAGNWGTHVGASSVFPQGSMSGVSPSTTWTSTGPEGGPFSPSSQVYTLQSASGDTGVAYTVTSLPSWLDASSTYGQLWGNTNVTLSVNSNANSLRPGTYTDTVVFADCYNGGNSFSRTVRLVVEEPCYADCNGDGRVNTQDVICFLNLWNARDPRADCNGDRNVNTQDVICFLNLWNAGC